MVRAKTTTPTIKGIAVRFTNWIGGTIAKPESTMTTPAMGDIVRPIWPEIRAIAPRFGIGIPKEAACGVTASLKAKVAGIAGTGNGCHDERTERPAPAGDLVGAL